MAPTLLRPTMQTQNSQRLLRVSMTVSPFLRPYLVNILAALSLRTFSSPKVMIFSSP